MSPTRFAAKLYRARFMGRRVAVSGAARGLGQANARCFAESGASVFVIDRDDFVKHVVEDPRGKCCNAGGGPSPNLRPDCPAADTTESGPELLAGMDAATRHAHRQAWASAIDRSRTLLRANDLDITAWRQDQQHSPGPNVVVGGGSQTRPVPRDDPLAALGCPTQTAPHRYGGATVRPSSVSAYHGE